MWHKDIFYLDLIKCSALCVKKHSICDISQIESRIFFDVFGKMFIMVYLYNFKTNNDGCLCVSLTVGLYTTCASF